MKKLFKNFLVGALLLSVCACAQKNEAKGNEETNDTHEKVELTVFAAASLTEALGEIVKNYEAKYSYVTISTNLDSSGTLATQIAEGADCDVFISASKGAMNKIDINDTTGKNTSGADCIIAETRINLLENKVALVVPNGNPANVSSFADLANANLIALGNSDVPVGSYSLEILKSLNIDITALEAAGKVSYGSNVKEVTTQVSESSVDAGIVYATDATSAGLKIVDTATKDMCSQVIYPAALVKQTKNQEEAQKFLDYLSSAEAQEVFERIGFAMAK